MNIQNLGVSRNKNQITRDIDLVVAIYLQEKHG